MFDEEYLSHRTLQCIKDCFDSGQPASFRLAKYPGKLLRLWSSGQLEEIEFNLETEEISVVEIIETDFDPDFIKRVYESGNTPKVNKPWLLDWEQS